MNSTDDVPEVTEEDEELPVGEEEPELEDLDLVATMAAIEAGLPSSFVLFDSLVNESSPLVSARGLEVPPDTWGTAFDRFDEAVEDLFQYFNWAQAFQERTPEFIDHGTETWDQFEWIQQQMPRLGQAAEQGDGEQFVLALQEIQRSLVVLRSALDSLKELEENQPQLSPAPFVNELLRLGRGLTKGTIAKEAFAERLAAYQDIQSQVQDMIKGGEGLSPEEREKVEASFALQAQGLEELFGYLDSDDLAQLEEGLGHVDEAWAELLELRSQVQQSIVSANSRPCPRCAHSNDLSSRFCANCNAKLPDTGQYSATSQIQLNEKGSKVLGANFVRIQTAVDKMATGELTAEAFAEEVQWFRKIHTQSVKLFENIDEPDDSTPADQVALFDQGCALSAQGLLDIQAGLEKLESYVAGNRGPLGPQELLAQGMTQIRQGGEALLQLEPLAKQTT